MKRSTSPDAAVKCTQLKPGTEDYIVAAMTGRERKLISRVDSHNEKYRYFCHVTRTFIAVVTINIVKQTRAYNVTVPRGIRGAREKGCRVIFV